MKAMSLGMFRTKLRPDDEGTVLVNIGDVIEGDADQLRALSRNQLVRILDQDAEDEAEGNARADARGNASGDSVWDCLPWGMRNAAGTPAIGGKQ